MYPIPSVVFCIMIYFCFHIVRPGLNSGRGWGFSKVVATFNHVGGSLNLVMATDGDV